MAQLKAQTLSLIIPVYNEELYLRACLEAVAAQTVAPAEVIVIDNKSDDGSLKIAQDFSFVRVIHEPKPGVLYARTRGFNATKSTIIGRIDADTLLPPTWVEQVLKIFTDDSVAAVTGPVSYYDMPRERIGFHIDKMARKAIVRGDRAYPFLFGTNMALRVSHWKRLKSRVCDDPSIHEDIDIAIHLFNDDQRIVYDENMTARMSARRYDDNLAGFMDYLATYRQTYARHAINSPMTWFAMSLYFFGFVVLKPLRWLYNPRSRSYHLRNLFTRNTARRHPYHKLDA